MEEGEENKITSSYNEGYLQIQRLDELWRRYTNSSLKGDLENCKFILDRVWDEHVGDVLLMDDDEKEEILEENKSHKAKIALCNTNDYKSRGRLYQYLSDRLAFLKKLQNITGKGTKYKDMSHDDFE